MPRLLHPNLTGNSTTIATANSHHNNSIYLISIIGTISIVLSRTNNGRSNISSNILSKWEECNNKQCCHRSNGANRIVLRRMQARSCSISPLTSYKTKATIDHLYNSKVKNRSKLTTTSRVRRASITKIISFIELCNKETRHRLISKAALITHIRSNTMSNHIMWEI